MPKRRLPISRRKQEIEWVDLDKYIELLLDSKSEDKIVFIYCNPKENRQTYDLQICSYDDRNEDKYYTLSGKCLSVYEGDHLTDFISLAQWLFNQDSYFKLKTHFIIKLKLKISIRLLVISEIHLVKLA